MQITYSISSALCNMSWATWYKGTTQLLSLTECKLHLFELFILLAEPFNNVGREETGYPEKPLVISFRRCHILKPEDSSPKQDSNPHNSIGGQVVAALIPPHQVGKPQDCPSFTLISPHGVATRLPIFHTDLSTWCSHKTAHLSH